MNTKDNGNPGKRLLGFFLTINLLPVGMMENSFSIKMESLRFIYLPLWLTVHRSYDRLFYGSRHNRDIERKLANYR